MTPEALETELKKISSRLDNLNKQTPDMTGQDFAFERGHISAEEYRASEKAAKEGVRLQTNELNLIEELRVKYRSSFDTSMQKILAGLRSALTDLQRLYPKRRDPMNCTRLESDADFKKALLPSVITCLDDWHGDKEPKHWPAWAWRVVFNSLEESNQIISDTQKG